MTFFLLYIYIYILEVGVWQALKQNTTTRHQMLEMNLSAFKLSSIRTRDVHIISTCCLNHHTSCYLPMPTSNWSRWRVPDTYTTITILHAELEIVRKFDIVPLSLSIFVFPRILVYVYLYVALPWIAAIMIAMLSVHGAAKVIAPYKLILDALQIMSHILTNAPLYGFSGPTSKYVCTLGRYTWKSVQILYVIWHNSH